MTQTDLHMAVKVTVAPTWEPVTLAEAQVQCRVDGGQDDPVLAAMISEARQWVEALTGRAIPRQTLRLSLDAFPCGELRLPRPPLAAVSALTYVDAAGTTQTLSSALYRVDDDSEPARIEPVYGTAWPATQPVSRAVQVTYTAGYASAALVPAVLRRAILWKVEQLHLPAGPTDDQIQSLVQSELADVVW